MKIKISKSDWQRIGVKMGWWKKAQAEGSPMNINWKDITVRYRAIDEKMKGPDPLGRGLIPYIEELEVILSDMAWGGGSGLGSEFTSVMNDAIKKMKSVKDSLTRSTDDKFDGSREGSRGQLANAEKYLQESYGDIISAHKIYKEWQANGEKNESGSAIPSLMSKIEALDSPVMTKGGYKVDLDEIQENPLKAGQRIMAWAEATGNDVGYTEILNRFSTPEVEKRINQEVAAMGKNILEISSQEFKEKAGIQDPKTIRQYLYNEMLREIFVGMQNIKKYKETL